MDSITRFPAQMTANHPVVLLQMPDGRFNRLPTLEQLELFFVQPLRLAPVIDLNARVLLIDPAVAEIDVHRGRLDAVVLQQDRRLLDLFSQRSPSKGLPPNVLTPTTRLPCSEVAMQTLAPNS